MLARRIALAAAFQIVFAASSISAQMQDFFRLLDNGTPQQVQAAINKGADVNAQNGDGWTPLIEAACYNPRPEVIADLLRAGADVNAWDSLSMTALSWAATCNTNPSVVTVLLEAGADLESRDIGGDTPLMFAARYNQNPRVVSVLSPRVLSWSYWQPEQILRPGISWERPRATTHGRMRS